jgi:hypothetical protein
MAHKAEKDIWPWWTKWALIAVVLTSILTIVATLNDIY